MTETVKTEVLFDLTHTLAAPLLERCEYPWQALPILREYIQKLGKTLDPELYSEIAPEVWAAKTAVIAPTAYIEGPAIIGENAQISHCAYIRGSAIVGAGAHVGNSTELKNTILFDETAVPHYNYVGDSILGFHAHLGAGAVTSNLKADWSNVVVKTPEGNFETGLLKMGAMVGDHAEIGCNTVLNPGTVVGRKAVVYPLSMVRGYVPADSIYKKQNEIVKKRDTKAE